ncbi:hypothetical protein [Rheinheimera riviphila]|nr:hypothetical protein [Rheinheimera riviphila]
MQRLRWINKNWYPTYAPQIHLPSYTLYSYKQNDKVIKVEISFYLGK